MFCENRSSSNAPVDRITANLLIFGLLGQVLQSKTSLCVQNDKKTLRDSDFDALTSVALKQVMQKHG